MKYVTYLSRRAGLAIFISNKIEIIIMTISLRSLCTGTRRYGQVGCRSDFLPLGSWTPRRSKYIRMYVESKRGIPFQRCRNSNNDRSSSGKLQLMKYTKYVKIVTKYGLGVDLDTYLYPAIGVSVLVLITIFGLSGLALLGAAGLGIILASSVVFLSLGWLLLPLFAFILIGALVAGFSSLFLFPIIAAAVGFGALSMVSQLAFSRMDDELVAEALDSLDEDGRFSQMELERFDERMARRNTK